MRSILLFLVIAGAHVAATIVCGVAESITDAFLFSPPSSAHGFWSSALKVLEFPFLTVLRTHDAIDSPYYVYIMVLNSLFWAAAFLLGIRVYRKRFVNV